MAAKTLKIHEVVKYPDPVLAKPGAPVTVFDEALKKLVAEMFESMYAAQGIGLAAPQIAISQRLTVIDVSFKKNPKEKLVQRAAWVKVKAQNERGEWFEVEGEELLARALLHEIDHLNGVLFIDRISRLKRELVLRKIRKLQKNGEW
jgi:peptide deformylase